MSKNKVFKTIDEQIEILRKKGLTIEDEFEAKEILLRENYFFISGYRFLLMKSYVDRCFVPGATFNELYALFHFDRHIRNIIFKNILIIENNVKSMMAYHLSKQYGIKENNYLNPNNFTKDPERKKQVNDLINKMKRQIRINGRQHSATVHYLDNYGYVPLWIVVKVLSFGIVSELYTILKSEDQNEIAGLFHIDTESLLIYLPVLSNYRNLCAHEDILYDHKAQRDIPDTVYHKELSIPKMDGDYIYGKDDVFALIIMLKRLLRKDDFTLFMNELDYEIQQLDAKIKSISIGKILDKMGFPINYLEIVRMN